MRRTKGRSNNRNRVLGILNKRPDEGENPRAERNHVPDGKHRRKRRAPQRNLKETAKNFAFIFVVLAIIGGLYYWVSSSNKYLREHGVKVVGTISHMGGSNIPITFSFLGKQYNVVGSQTNGSLQDGETYTVLIDKDDPTDFICDFTEPVFDMSEFDIVKIQDISKLLWSNKIMFSYTFGRQTYKRFQAVESDIDPDNFKGKVVLYVNRQDPRVAYVIFNGI